MQERKNKGYTGRRDSQDFNIFKHLIFCSQCGGQLYYDHRGNRYKDKIYPHYKCNNARLSPEVCAASNLRFEHVFGLFLSAIKNAEKTTYELADFSQISDVPEKFIRSLLPLKAQSRVDKDAYNKKNAELGEYELKLDNLNRNLSEANFDIPVSVMKKLAELEQIIASLKSEIEVLAAGNIEFDLEVNSQESIMALFKTNDGRAKLNNYFKANKLRFYAALDKASGVGKLEIKQELPEGLVDIIKSTVIFPKKRILQAYNIPDLQEMFDLTVS